MKCYRMHRHDEGWYPVPGTGNPAKQWFQEPKCVDAVTIYRGFAVCQEHLEEMGKPQINIPSVWIEPFTQPPSVTTTSPDLGGTTVWYNTTGEVPDPN